MIVCNRPLTVELARVISEIFTDVIIAPEFEAEARALLQKKKNLRLMKMNDAYLAAKKAPVIRSCPGGLMVMDRDHTALGLDNLEEQGRHQAPADRGGDAGDALRLAGRQTRQVERHRLRHQPTARSASAPAR